MIKRLMVLLLVSLTASLVQAQPSLPKLAVEYQGSLYVMNSIPASEADLPSLLTLVSDRPTDNFNAVWSPDGTKLAYAISPEGDPFSFQKTLMVWDGTQSIELVNQYGANFPLGWTRDGRIYYPTYGAPLSSDNMQIPLKVATIAPESGATPDDSSEGAQAMVGCGIGALIPMDGQLSSEIDTGVSRSILVQTDYGLIFPAECGGNMSLYQSASGNIIHFADGTMIRAVLSPDGTRLAGIIPGNTWRAGNIVMVDLLTLNETTFTLTEPASVVTWGDDGSLYYASVSKSRYLLDGLTPEQITQITTLTHTPDPSTSEFFAGNTVRLYRRAPDGTETLLHEQDAYAVGKLAFSRNTLVYSTISNGDAWVRAMLDGSLAADEVYFEKAFAYIPVSVNIITLNADGSVAEANTLPGDLRHVAVAK